MISIGFLLIDGFALMSYSSVIEPLRAANLLSEKKLYKIANFSPNGNAKSSSDAIIDTQIIGSEKDKLDIVIVCAGGDPFLFDNIKVFDWLRKKSREGITIGGVSGGPVILAKAGLMDGKRMTLHWEHTDTFHEIWPTILLEKSLFVIDRKRITCAGGIAPLDLMYTLITNHYGEGFARKVSDWFMHTEVRPSGGPQRSGIVERYNVNNSKIVSAIEIMENNLSNTLSLKEISKIVNISPRQLNRLFKKNLKKTTMDIYRKLRLELAQKLLAQSHLSITEIAFSCGFSSSSQFSQSFKEKFGVMPSKYKNL